MPLLSKLFAFIATGLVAVLGRFMSYTMAAKFASYTAWITIVGAFLASVFVCISSLLTAVQAVFSSAGGGVNGGLVSALGMGMGMLIPANAGGVLACVASVWMATAIYKMQQFGIANFSK